MPRSRMLRARLALVLLAVSGCGPGSSGTRPPGGSGDSKPILLIGFDASPPLVEALRAGKIQGLVVQNPLKMGELGVKTLVAHLEKRKVESVIATGETTVTAENMNEPEIKSLLEPPKASHASGQNGSGSKAKKWRVMVIPKGTTHEFWKTIHAGAIKAADELGNVEIIWQGPLKEDERTDQIKLVQNAAAVGVDGIVLAPLDQTALVEPVEQAIGKGIPVVIIDSGLKSKQPVSYVATDNYHGGVLAAKRMGEVLKGKGRVLLLRYMVGSESTDQRERGFLDTLAKEFPGITIVSRDQYAGATSDKAQQVSQNLVTRFRGQLDGIFCPNESSTFGMLRALEGAGLLASRRP